MNQGTLRKSSRQPVPNRIYSQGINDLKKENTLRNKKKTRNNEESNQSIDEQRNSQQIYDYPMHSNDSKQPYLSCRFSDGSHKRVKFIVGARQEQKKKEKHEKQIISTPKAVVNNKKPANLLSLFLTAIQGVDNGNDAANQENQHLNNRMLPQKSEPLKQIQPKQKRMRSQGQDYIKKLRIENGYMKITHSQLHQIEIPVDWQESEMKQESNKQIQQIKRKLQNCKILQNISILA